MLIHAGRKEGRAFGPSASTAYQSVRFARPVLGEVDR